jgi:nucleoside 2-deoxyribosyltransferase
LGLDAFDDWHSVGPDADDHWKAYELARGRTYQEALQGHAARHVFEFDRQNIDRCGAVLLVLPAGKSGHLELGYAIGRGKYGFILLDEADVRWDVMYGFAHGVFKTEKEMYCGIDYAIN